MAQNREIHGVPMTIHRDGWWLDDGPAQPAGTRQRRLRPLALLLVLILLADVLFYRQSVGLSLALFALALVAAAQRRTPRPAPLAVLILSLLPVIDHVQLLSVVIFCFGLIISIAMSRLPLSPPATTLRAALSLATQIPLRAARDLASGVARLQVQSNAARRFGRAWAFPLGGVLVLISLLAAANPVLDGWLSGLADLPFDPGAWLRQLTFWTGLVLLVWPLLVADPHLPPPPLPPEKPCPPASA